MVNVDLTEVPEDLQNKWVAIEDSTSEIIGHGESVLEAEQEAQKTGKEYFLLFLTPCTGGFLL